MKPSQMLVGMISFILGGIVSLVVFNRSTDPCIQPVTQNWLLESAAGGQRHSNPKRLKDIPRPALSDEYPKPVENQIDRKSLRRLLSIAREDFGDPEELIGWGLSEEDSIEVSAAYAETIESIRRVEAKLATVQTDEDGNEYLHVPAHADKTKSIISALEKRLHKAFPGASAGFLAEIVFADVLGTDKYRSDEFPRIIYQRREQDGSITYYDKLISEEGEELVSQVYVCDPGDEDVPPPLAHLFEGAQWSDNRLHDNR